MIKLLRPIIFAFLTSDAVNNLVVDLPAAYAERTDNEVDECPETQTGPVLNGCSIEQLCGCDEDWKNHGQFMKCVSHSAGCMTDSVAHGIAGWFKSA